MTEYLFQGEFNPEPDENLLFILMPTCFHFQLFVYKVNKRDLSCSNEWGKCVVPQIRSQAPI